jgi:hypothetical protein
MRNRKSAFAKVAAVAAGLAALIAFAGIAWLLSIGDLNRAGIFGSGGEISSGVKFGVTLGEPISAARATLRNAGFVRGSPSRSDACLGRTVRDGETVELWDDPSWRNGTICVFSRGSTTTRIAWSIGGWQL